MNQLDPSIPMSGVQPVNALQLMQVQMAGQEMQQRNLAMQEQQQAISERNALMRLSTMPGMRDEKTGMPTPQYVTEASRFARPETVNKLAEVAQNARHKAAEEEMWGARTRVYGVQALLDAQKVDASGRVAIGDAAAGLKAQSDALKAKGWKEPEIKAYMESQVLPDTVKRLRSGVLPPGLADKLSTTWDEAMNDATIAATTTAKELRDREKPTGDNLRHFSVGDVTVTEERGPDGKWAFKAQGPRFSPVQTGVGDLVGLDDQTLNYAADVYRRTGLMPPMGQGKAGAEARKEILTRAAGAAQEAGSTAGEDIAGQKGVKADAASLNKVQSMFDAVESFTKNAIANGKVLQGLAEKVDQTGIPAIERWTRAGRKSLAGDPDVAAFNAQMTVFRNEMAKIVTNPNLTGVLTVEAQREMAETLDRASSAAQIKSVVNVLQGDAARRRKSLEEQIAEIKGRIGGKKDGTAAAGGEVIDFSRLKGGR